jgi:hypothetical protein
MLPVATSIGFVNLSLPQTVILPGDLAVQPPPSAVGAIVVAFFQYLVLSLLIRRVSWIALMWIPVSVLVTVGANAADATFWSIAGGIQNAALLQLLLSSRGFPVVAMFLGLAQGILLAQLFDRKAAIWLWCSAAVLVPIIDDPLIGWLRYDSMRAAVLSELALAVVYGIVTAVALLVVINKAGRPNPGQHPWKLDAQSAHT